MNGRKTLLVYAVVIDQAQLYTDLTGIFLQRSSKGNWNIMVVYSFDCNCINIIAMKSKSANEWLKAFGDIFQELISRGCKPKLQKMDNEAPAALKSYFTEKHMIYSHIATGATPLSASSGLSRNTLWQACTQYIHIYPCIFGIS
jgi:hypothetical protein